MLIFLLYSLLDLFFHYIYLLHRLLSALPSPSAPQLLTLGSKLTWASSAIFSLSQSTSLSVFERGFQETSPQHTVLISSRQTWAKEDQPDSTAEKVIPPPPPCPARYSYSVHAATPAVHAFLRPSGLQRHVEVYGQRLRNVSKREEVTEGGDDGASQPKNRRRGNRENGITFVRLVEAYTVVQRALRSCITVNMMSEKHGTVNHKHI